MFLVNIVVNMSQMSAMVEGAYGAFGMLPPAGSDSGIGLLLVTVVLTTISVTAGVLGGYKRIDTTKAEKYTLSKGSANRRRSRKKDTMKVDAYVSRGLPKLDAYVRDLQRRNLIVPVVGNFGGPKALRAVGEEGPSGHLQGGKQIPQFGGAPALYRLLPDLRETLSLLVLWSRLTLFTGRG